MLLEIGKEFVAFSLFESLVFHCVVFLFRRVYVIVGFDLIKVYAYVGFLLIYT